LSSSIVAHQNQNFDDSLSLSDPNDSTWSERDESTTLSYYQNESTVTDYSLSSNSAHSPSSLSVSNVTTATPSPPTRESLLPTNSVRHFGNGDDGEEDDDYDLVGFSLMDALPEEGDDNEGEDGHEGESSPLGQDIIQSPSSPLGSQTKLTTRTSPEHIMDSPSFQGSDLSPIVATKGTSLQQASLSSYLSLKPLSQSPSSSFTGQQITSLELQSKLQRQLLKCQTKSEKMLNAAAAAMHNEGEDVNVVIHPHREDVVIHATNKVIAQNTSGGNTGTSGNGESDNDNNNAIFGAWAEIESLRRRCQEAEDRERRERDRAESMSYELSLIEERRPVSLAGDDDDDISEGGASTTTGEQEVAKANLREGGELAMDAAPTTDEGGIAAEAPPANDHRKSQPIDNDDTTPQDPGHDATAKLWKVRALEAEDRLAKEVERLERATAAANAAAQAQAAAASAPPPPSSRQEEETPELIRLKNAEIDVLRSQIHRLERRVREERDRNDDLLRSSSYLHGRHPLDVDVNAHHPPLVVASECMTTTTTASSSNPNKSRSTVASEVDEFRLLRNEMRHLQYQLRTAKTIGNNSGTNPTSAYSTTGESTLSSLDDGDVNGGNDYDDDDADDGDGGNEVEVNENNVSSSSSVSSMWGLCCVRRSRRGYGRV